MPERVERILSRHADLFLKGRLEAMLEHYVHPLAFFVGGQIFARQRESETIAALFGQRSEAISRGMKDISWSIVERGPDDAERIPVMVDWNILNAADKVVAHIRVRYFFEEQPDGSLLIVMVEHVDGDLKFVAPKPPAGSTRH